VTLRLLLGLYAAGLLAALGWMIAALLKGFGVISLTVSPNILVGGMALVLASRIGALFLSRTEPRHG
jgi:hypothetical protein